MVFIIMTEDIEKHGETHRKNVQLSGNEEVSMMERCIDFLERDTRGIQIVTYGITTIGLLTAVYRIRPLSKFTKPSDIPLQFVKQRIALKGIATRIEPSDGALIMVDHKPLIGIPRVGKAKYLPVKVAGVDVTNHGISWLQTVVTGREIEFIPLVKRNDLLECAINFQETKERKVSVGEELVSLGFGTVGHFEPDESNDEDIIAYRAVLNRAQKRAKLERNGHWHFTINPTYLWRLRNLVHVKMSQCHARGFYRTGKVVGSLVYNNQHFTLDDIKKRCEDAVFEVCDARERYPSLCANQLARCIRLESELCVAPVKLRSSPKVHNSIMTEEQISFLKNVGIGSNEGSASNRIANILKKMENLQVTAEQIEREKYGDINEILRK